MQFINVPFLWLETNQNCTCTGMIQVYYLHIYYLHEKTGNFSWKIKWFAPFHLESLRKKYGL